ncbi:hypothetical protein [Streptomyces sp. NPDC060035]
MRTVPIAPEAATFPVHREELGGKAGQGHAGAVPTAHRPAPP